MLTRAMLGALVVSLLAAVVQACGGDESGEETQAAGGSSSSSGGAGGEDNPCAAACERDWPGGVTSAQLMADCVVCGACYDACDGGVGDVCPTGSELGCSANAASCDDCLQGNCAYQIDLTTMTASGTCASQAQGCIDNPDCLELLNCLSTCPG